MKRHTQCRKICFWGDAESNKTVANAKHCKPDSKNHDSGNLFMFFKSLHILCPRKPTCLIWNQCWLQIWSNRQFMQQSNFLWLEHTFSFTMPFSIVLTTSQDDTTLQHNAVQNNCVPNQTVQQKKTQHNATRENTQSTCVGWNSMHPRMTAQHCVWNHNTIFCRSRQRNKRDDHPQNDMAPHAAR